MWNAIEVSAPGKLILHGEHAVVYGKAAIAVSLGLRTRVLMTPNQTENVSLHFQNQSTQQHWSVQDLMSIMNQIEDVDSVHPPTSAFLDKIKLFLYETSSIDKKTSPSQKLSVTIFLFLYLCINKKYGKSVLQPMTITVNTELSIGAGMGSSASYSVALATAFLAVNGQLKNYLSPEDLKCISMWSFSSESIAHGRPSGIDNSICTYGGAILFKDYGLSAVLPNSPLLKVLLVDTGVERTTSHMIANVKQKGNTFPSVISHIMDTIDAVSETSWTLLKAMVEDGGNPSEYMSNMQTLVKMNQHLLNCLDVSHPKLNEICTVAEEHGCAAKLTGAGGGGCAFIVLPWEKSEDVKCQNLKQALSSLGYKFWDISFGGPGVTLTIH